MMSKKFSMFDFYFVIIKPMLKLLIYVRELKPNFNCLKKISTLGYGDFYSQRNFRDTINQN